MKKYYFIFIVFILCIFKSSAQELLKSVEEDYYDFLSLQGLSERPTLTYRTLSDSVWNISENSIHLWNQNNLGRTKVLWQKDTPVSNIFTNGIIQGVKYKIISPNWYNSYNTAAPYGQNDGAIWQGRGYNTYLTGGIFAEFYGLSITLKPQIIFIQNLSFDYTKPNYSGDLYKDKANLYGDYSLGCIDAPQRFGNKPLFNFDLSDTEIRYSWHTITLGFGNQNIWIGPAQDNPIIHSNTAAGYPHLDFGIRRQKIQINNVDLGDIEFRYWAGKTSESNFFDNDDSNNDTLITGLAVAYEIPFIKGLSIGLNRTMLTKWNNKSAYSFFTLLIPFMKKKAGYDESDQRASIFADYCIPEGGIDIYFEWGKNDYNSGFDNLIRYPFHTQAITAGFKKNIYYKKAPISGQLLFELTFIESSMDYHFFYDWGGIGNDFYTHHIITQGYTNKGQYLGAGIGAGGNSQLISYKIYYPKGSTRIFVQRLNPDLNYSYFLAYRNPESSTPNEDVKSSIRVICNLGVESNYFVTKDFLLSLNLVFSDEHNPLNKNDNIKKQTNQIKSEHRFNFVSQISLKYFF